MPMVSRGLTATVIPPWVKPGVAVRAAEFVAVAATPDVRVDEAPVNAWRRATSMMTPALVTELDGGLSWEMCQGGGDCNASTVG